MRDTMMGHLAISALLLSGLAAAEPSSGDMPALGTTSPEFYRLDLDKDGRISKEEAVTNNRVAERWDRLDMDRDGHLNAAEFARFEVQPYVPPKLR